jgi:hypothetical protein
LKRATKKEKKEYLENLCNEIWNFKEQGVYDLMYMKTKELGWKYTQGIENIAIEDSKGNRIVEKIQVLQFGRIILQNYTIDLIDRKL